MELTLFGFDVLEIVAKLVLAASVLYVLLPPVEVFDPFPEARRWYAVVVAVVGYFALNARGKLMALYPQFKNGKPTELKP